MNGAEHKRDIDFALNNCLVDRGRSMIYGFEQNEVFCKTEQITKSASFNQQRLIKKNHNQYQKYVEVRQSSPLKLIL